MGDQTITTAEVREDEQNADELLPETAEDMDQSEKEVISHVMGVSMKSQKFDGMCGRITNVQIVRDEDVSEEHKDFFKKLSTYSEDNSRSIDPDAQEKISAAQKELRKSLNMDARDEFEIAVTVELPDGRTFTETYTAPRFDSNELDNDFLKLYRDVLGKNVNSGEKLVGSWVPVDETDERSYNSSFSYNIDLEYYDRKQDQDDDDSGGLLDMDDTERNMIIMSSIMLLLVVGVFML